MKPSNLAHDRVGEVLGLCRSAQIRRADLPGLYHALDRANHSIVQIPQAEMIQHHRARPDSADRVGDALPHDVWRRPMDWLEHRRVRPVWVDVAAWSNAEAAGDCRTDIGQ